MKISGARRSMVLSEPSYTWRMAGAAASRRCRSSRFSKTSTSRRDREDDWNSRSQENGGFIVGPTLAEQWKMVIERFYREPGHFARKMMVHGSLPVQGPRRLKYRSMTASDALESLPVLIFSQASSIFFRSFCTSFQESGMSFGFLSGSGWNTKSAWSMGINRLVSLPPEPPARSIRVRKSMPMELRSDWDALRTCCNAR